MLCFPPAKINIGLNVIRKRPDGYHDLETVFYPIPLHDNLEIRTSKPSAAEGCQLSLAGQRLDCLPENNLVVRVYRSLQEEFALPGVEVDMYKRIPTGAGLGGGSSDAACMMKMLNEHFALGLQEEEMERRLGRLGADCPFFVRCRPVFATGIGDVMTPVELSLKGWTLVLVKPPVSVSTREAYEGLVPQGRGMDLDRLLTEPVESWREWVVNDFEDSVFMRYPQIAAIKATLYDMGAAYASMSGSGSSVFGLFRHKVEEIVRVFDDCFVFQELLRV